MGVVLSVKQKLRARGFAFVKDVHDMMVKTGGNFINIFGLKYSIPPNS